MLPVNIITEECNTMLEFIKTLPTRRDILSIKTRVEEDLVKLNGHFENNPRDEETLKELKRKTQMDAIGLEYLLRDFSMFYDTRYRNRHKVVSKYREYVSKFDKSYLSFTNSIMANYLSDLRILSHIASRSKEIVFDLTEEEIAAIDTITCRLEEYLGDNIE